ncbi:MAG: hypothetical protein QXT73_07105 [Candidatus Methanomethylicaceae archaeon]
MPIAVPVLEQLLIVLITMFSIILAPVTSQAARDLAIKASSAQAQTVTMNHADLKHGEKAQLVRECADKPIIRMLNPSTGRIALICKTSVGWFGVLIRDGKTGNEITAFPKEKAKTIGQVIKYLRNAGYEIIH